MATDLRTNISSTQGIGSQSRLIWRPCDCQHAALFAAGSLQILDMFPVDGSWYHSSSPYTHLKWALRLSGSSERPAYPGFCSSTVTRWSHHAVSCWDELHVPRSLCCVLGWLNGQCMNAAVGVRSVSYYDKWHTACDWLAGLSAYHCDEHTEGRPAGHKPE